MKLLIVLWLLVPIVIGEDDLKSEYMRWMKKNSKSFVSKKHAGKSFKNFGETHARIKAHNEKFDAGEESFRMGHNHMSDKTPVEFKRSLVDFSQYVKPSARAPNTAVKAPRGWVPPTNFDLRTPNIPVKDQGGCGSCWAFSAVSVKEHRIYSLLKRYVKLSEQHCVDCADSGACNGGMMGSCLDVHLNNGMYTEVDYPYIGLHGKCQNKAFYQLPSAINRNNVLPYYEVSGDELEMAYVLTQRGWISACLDAEPLMSYESGIVMGAHCTTKINHAVTIVGFGRESNNNYWLVRNSWSSDWGLEGHFKILRGRNTCGIANKDEPYCRVHN